MLFRACSRYPTAFREEFETVNFLDWVLIALFVIGAIWGYRKGLINAVLLAVSIYIALLLSGQFAARLLTPIWEGAEDQAVATAAGYVIIFIGVFIAGRIASHFIKSSLGKFKIGWLDGAGGLVLGVVAGLLLAGGLLAVMARYTYVVDEQSAGVDGDSSGFSPEAVVSRLRDAAESFLVDSGRDRSNKWLTESEVAGVLIEVRNVLPGSALGLYPVEFNTAIDILESKRDGMEDGHVVHFRGISLQSNRV